MTVGGSGYTRETGTAAIACEKCGETAGHVWTDDDCILDHADHADRYVGLLCSRHYHWIDATLEQILELFALLPGAALPGKDGGDGRHSKGSDAPAPGRLDVMALTDPRSHGPHWVMPSFERNWNGRVLEDNGPEYPDVLAILGGWVKAVIEERPVKPNDLPDFLPLTQMIQLLHQHRHWIAQQPWIDDYVIELNDVHLALARGVRVSMWPAAIGKCPNCDRKLYNTIGVDEVTCRGCKSVWSGVDLARLRLILEQEEAKPA